MTAITSTGILASWQLPPVDSRHGNITGFKLYFKRKGFDESSTVPFINSVSVLSKTVTGLDMFTEYELQVLAFTSVGDGPKSSVKVVRTKEDGKRYRSSYIIERIQPRDAIPWQSFPSAMLVFQI